LHELRLGHDLPGRKLSTIVVTAGKKKKKSVKSLKKPIQNISESALISLAGGQEIQVLN